MDRPTDELLQRLLAAVAADGGERAGEIVRTARDEAEAEVKELVKSAVKAVLLRNAVAELEAAPTPPAVAPAPAAPSATACYVYAITRREWGEPPPGVRGLDGRSPLLTVRSDDLQAITSDVPLEEFGPGAIDDRLKDLAWVEQHVRAHDGVVKALAATGTVIPCRFCTIVPADSDAALALERHRDSVRATLARIDGKQEWGVKLLADVRGAPAAVPPDHPGTSSDAGRAYLAQKKRHGDRRDEVLRHAGAAADECHRDLSSLAAESALLPTRDRGGSRGWHLALNAAYLVRDTDTSPFHARVNELSARYRPQGLRLDLTGPWPPYNFAALELSEAAP